jgi:tRNA nucleotidyltransferase (CCA-adding enzyme)
MQIFLLGEAMQKKTLIKKDSYDIDVFLRFDKNMRIKRYLK